MQSSEKTSNWIELLKYPVLVFSILISLIVGRYTIGIKFGEVEEVNTTGVKFRGDTSLALIDINTKVKELTTRVDQYSKEVKTSASAKQEIDSKAFVASQTVDNSTAKAVQASSPIDQTSQLSGYVWIGNFDIQKGWTVVNLAETGSNKEITVKPSEMRLGAKYIILGNMVVRNGLPANDDQYFRGKTSLGVVPIRTTVEILEAPVGINRDFAVQYWAKLRVVN
jgi:outer membrane murein-binding lipoprotein Lpp